MARIGWLAVVVAIGAGCHKEEPAHHETIHTTSCELDVGIDAFGYSASGAHANYLGPVPTPASVYQTWKLGAPSCGVVWYHQAALLLRSGIEPPLIAHDGTRVERSIDALTAALAARDGDSRAWVDAAAYAAFVHGTVPGDAPALPDDACARAQAADADAGSIAYVCDHRDAPAYAEAPFPDVSLRRLEALAGKGYPGQVATLGKAVKREMADEQFGVTDADTKALEARLARASTSTEEDLTAPCPELAEEDVLADWKAVLPHCHGIDWYLTAARLLRAGAAYPLIADDGTALENARHALRLALDAPDSPAWLRLAAYLQFLRGMLEVVPELPEGACQRASKLRAREPVLAAYVCGQWDKIPDDDAPYPDVLLRRIEALMERGKNKQARDLEVRARAMIAKGGRDVLEDDRVELLEELEQSLSP